MTNLPQTLRSKNKKKEKNNALANSKRTRAMALHPAAVDEAIILNLTETLPVMIYLVEPVPPYAPIYVNPAFESLGYPIGEWCNNVDLWVKVIHEDDRENILRKTAEMMSAGQDTDFEYRMVARDGSVRWVRDRGCFVRDEQGNPVCWQGIILDITERRLAVEALKENETRYRNLFENANDLMYIHDLAGNYISINGAAERVFGYTREEALKMNLKQIIAPEHIAFARRKMAEKAAGEKHSMYEVDCITREGMRLTMEINSCPIMFDGAPVAIQGIARNVTERKRAQEALRQSEEKYRELFENANDLIYTHDLQGFITSLNRAGELITGYTREEVVGTGFNIAQVVAPEYLERARQQIARKVESDVPTAYEVEIISKDGRRVSLELSTRLIYQNNQPIGVQGIARDITERKRAEASLRRTVTLLTSTLESTTDGILVTNSAGEIVVFNEKLLEMWGLTRQFIETQSTAAVVALAKTQLKEPEAFAGAIENLFAHPLTTSFDILEFKDGRLYERYSQPHIMEGEAVGRVWSYRDITERRRAEQQLMYNAQHDTLTNLPNRAALMNHLKTFVKRAVRKNNFHFAVLFLDLDRFKLINDSLGHIIGDKLLVAIAKRLQACVRPGDVVARLGGDEFTILLNNVANLNEAVKTAERLQQKLAEPFKLDSYEVFTSASIGIIFSDDVSREPEDFLRDADTAMYRAKEKGKARCEIFDRDMHVRNMNLLRLETDLRRAVERNEFEVFYQPIVSLATGTIGEFEALIRWRHPEHGLVMPDEFICVAEETGLIIPIGAWILEESCRQITEWQKRFAFSRKLSVSVNLSAKQLMHPNLTRQVRETLKRHQIDARCLKLEVTESTVMEHSDTALDILNELHDAGISLSTDDFGTGYSSLSYLHRFPFNRLKIDRSFIRKMDEDDKSAAIVRTILMLGRNLDLEVVAEGIETEAQFERLRALGCELGQGYLFSKPITAAAVEKLLTEGFQANQLVSLENASFGGGQILEVAEIQ